MCTSLKGHVLLFLWGKYLGMKWLDHMVSVCVVFKEPDKLFSKEVVPFPPAYESPSFSRTSSALNIISIFYFNHFYSKCVGVSYHGLISLMANDI